MPLLAQFVGRYDNIPVCCSSTLYPTSYSFASGLWRFSYCPRQYFAVTCSTEAHVPAHTMHSTQVCRKTGAPSYMIRSCFCLAPMTFTHEALDVLLGRLSICSIARLCAANKTLGTCGLRLLGNQPARLQALILGQVQNAAALEAQSSASNVSKQRLEHIVTAQEKCFSAVQWLLRARVDGQPVVRPSLMADHPDFLQQLFHIQNVPEQIACVLVRDAGITIKEQQLTAAVEQGVEGIEMWVSAVRVCKGTTDLSAWSEVICCNDVPYTAALPLPSKADIVLQLLQLAVNCKSGIALSLLDKQTIEDWRTQIPASLLQQLVLTSIGRGHDLPIVQRLMLIHPVTPDTIAAALRIELQALTKTNCVFSSRGDIFRLKHLPWLLEQEAADQLGPETIAEVALGTARLVDWPELIDHMRQLPAMQQLTPHVVATLMGIAIRRCECFPSAWAELHLLHFLGQLPSSSRIEQEDRADLMLAAEGARFSTMPQMLRQCANFAA